MKSEDFKFLALYTFTTFVVIFLFSFFTLDDYQSLSSHFGERPFEICRVITNHVYKDIYYGGLVNIFGLIGWYFLYGIYIFAFSFIATYLVDRYLFKGSFFQLEKASEGINPYKEKMKDMVLYFEKGSSDPALLQFEFAFDEIDAEQIARAFDEAQ